MTSPLEGQGPSALDADPIDFTHRHRQRPWRPERTNRGAVSAALYPVAICPGVRTESPRKGLALRSVNRALLGAFWRMGRRRLK